jgi:hypothetical protein
MKPTLCAVALATIGIGAAQAMPPHLPAFDPAGGFGTLYSITFYDDTSTTHTQWATQQICVVQGPPQGSNATGLWYSTSYYRWIGRWRQEGDQIFMTGDFWSGPGNDAIQLELVTTRDEAYGHWDEWIEDGSYGGWLGKGNTKVAKLGACNWNPPPRGNAVMAETWEEIEKAALAAAERAPVRYLRDGSLAKPSDPGQI